MTKEEVKEAVDGRVSEFLDGFVVVGFIANGDPVVITGIDDQKTAAAINLMLVNIVSNGGVSVNA